MESTAEWVLKVLVFLSVSQERESLLIEVVELKYQQEEGQRPQMLVEEQCLSLQSPLEDCW